MNIQLHIERIILDGLTIPYGERPLLQAAVETELIQLLSNGGLAPGLMGGGAMPHVLAGSIQLASDNDPTHMGQQIAQAVYGGIGQ